MGFEVRRGARLDFCSAGHDLLLFSSSARIRCFSEAEAEAEADPPAVDADVDGAARVSSSWSSEELTSRKWYRTIMSIAAEPRKMARV